METSSTSTGKSLSEALIFASNNPQYDNRLFIVHENCKLRTCCVDKLLFLFVFWHSGQFWYTTCYADVASFWKGFTCMYLLSLQNYCPSIAANYCPFFCLFQVLGVDNPTNISNKQQGFYRKCKKYFVYNVQFIKIFEIRGTADFE